jgi:hypothetical protein
MVPVHKKLLQIYPVGIKNFKLDCYFNYVTNCQSNGVYLNHPTLDATEPSQMYEVNT